MLCEMSALSWKERREGVEKAVQMGFTKEAIARAIGTNGANLGNMLDRDAPRTKFAEALDGWLRQHGLATNGGGGIGVPAVQVSGAGTSSPADPAIIIAQKLEALAAVLRSPDFDRAAKVEELSAVIKSLYDGLDSYRRAFKQGAKSGG